MREFIHIQGPAVSTDSRYSGVSYQFYNPVQLGKQPPQSFLDHASEYGTQYLSDYKQQRYQELNNNFNR
jgi:hypothetical protein